MCVQVYTDVFYTGTKPLSVSHDQDLFVCTRLFIDLTNYYKIINAN